MISEMKEEQNRKIEELNSSKALSDILERMDKLTQNQSENIEKNSLETRSLLESNSVVTRTLLANNQEQTKNLIESTNQATQNLLEERIANLNYKQEINELMNKIDNLENNMNQDTTQDAIKMIETNIQDMILSMREEQNEKMQELDTRSALTETQNLLEEKIANLNYKQEINELMNKVDKLENNMNQDTTSETIKMLEETFRTMISNVIANQNENLQKSSLETRSLLEERIQNLNYKEEMNSLMNKITDVEQAINSSNAEEKLNKVVEKIKLENEKKLEKLDSSAQIKEIMQELKKINNRYDKLAQEVNKNLTAMKENSQSTKTKSANKNKVIELETAKKKMKQEELIIEYGQEIQYEQLLDLAIGVYELNKNQDQRRAE